MRLFDIAPAILYAAMTGGFAGISISTENMSALGLALICAGLMSLCVLREAGEK